MTARQWTLKEPAAIFFIRKLHNHARYAMGVIENRHPGLDTCGCVGDEPHCRLVSGFVQYREYAASNLDPDNPAIKVRLGIRFAVHVHPGCTNLPVQPGCTNVSLSPLLQSMTNARDDGCAGCSQARPKTEHKSNMAGVYAQVYCRRIEGENQEK